MELRKKIAAIGLGVMATLGTIVVATGPTAQAAPATAAQPISAAWTCSGQPWGIYCMTSAWATSS